MALKKLPCEYPEIGIKRAGELIDNIGIDEARNLLEAIERCNKNLEKIQREKYLKNKIVNISMEDE